MGRGDDRASAPGGATRVDGLRRVPDRETKHNDHQRRVDTLQARKSSLVYIGKADVCTYHELHSRVARDAVDHASQGLVPAGDIGSDKKIRDLIR